MSELVVRLKGVRELVGCLKGLQELIGGLKWVRTSKLARNRWPRQFEEAQLFSD